MFKNQSIVIFLKLNFRSKRSLFWFQRCERHSNPSLYEKVRARQSSDLTCLYGKIGWRNGSINESGGAKWQAAIGPQILQIASERRIVLKNWPTNREGIVCDKSQSQIKEGSEVLQNWPPARSGLWCDITITNCNTAKSRISKTIGFSWIAISWMR